MIILPGLIDTHTHPRGLPTDEKKEDFYTATSAALAGGFTTILDMPNNPQTPTITYARLLDKQKIAKGKIICDVGFLFGSNGETKDFPLAEKRTLGLKIFLSFSTANLIIDIDTFRNVCEKWTTSLPIFLHAEEEIIKAALEITHETGQRVHICHVSSENELKQILDAKEKGRQVTCGVTPHHLFLTDEDVKKLGPYGLMKPPLKTKRDQDFLWKNLKYIDVVESDHAPHTRAEKESAIPSFGVPGLETTLPLLLTAMDQGRLTEEEIIEKCYSNPKRIFHLPDQPQTYVEVDETEEWTIKNENLFTKCKWTPFDGWKVRGKVKRVFLRGTKMFEDGKILGKPGSGKIITYIL